MPAFLDAVPPRERFAVTALGAALSLRNIAACRRCRPEPRSSRRSASADHGRQGARGRPPACRARSRDDGLEPRDCLGRADGARRGRARTPPSPPSTALRRAAFGSPSWSRATARHRACCRIRCLPDIVRIDGGWFRAIARQAATARLFGALVRAYRSSGAQVLVDGIATETALRVALDSGADSVSARCLRRPRSPATCFPTRRSAIEALLAERRVIPLFVTADRQHQAPLIDPRKTNHWMRVAAFCLSRRCSKGGGDDHGLRPGRQRQLLQAAAAAGQARHPVPPCRDQVRTDRRRARRPSSPRTPTARCRCWSSTTAGCSPNPTPCCSISPRARASCRPIATSAALAYQWLFFEQYSHEPYIAVRRALLIYPDRAKDATPERLASTLDRRREGAAA